MVRHRRWSLVGMAVSRGMRLLCGCKRGGHGQWSGGVGGGGGEFCLLAAAACIHGKQICHFSDFTCWRSQSYSLSSSMTPTSPLPPPTRFAEPLRQKDKIKSDVQTCPLHSFSISHLAFARQTWPRHVIQLLRLIRAGIFVMMSDDSRFH